MLHPQFEGGDKQVIAKGLAASPGAAVGRVYFTADDAVDAAERGEEVVLVRNETSPEDVHGMQVAEGILTARGGLVSHAAVVARGWGIPAVVGADAVKIAGHQLHRRRRHRRRGRRRSPSTAPPARSCSARWRWPTPSRRPSSTTILGWADRVRKGKLAVRANADTGADATVAREFGAEGIGLCRTEHMFLGEDRLPIVRAMILADTPEEEAAALEELRVAQKADFLEILEAMDGLPVTVRLLDPPLHEFLPSVEELLVKQATAGLDAEETDLLAAAESWREQNPMLGTRGVRLGVLKPGLYAMQVRALMEAAVERHAAGGNPVVEIMIPLTVTREEMLLARGWVEEAIAAVTGTDAKGLAVTIGTMIETPRAALRADEIAEVADFFSLRHQRPHPDDLRVQPRRRREPDDARLPRAGPAAAQPVRDHRPGRRRRAGGAWPSSGAAAAKPKLKLGVCGEHGGDPGVDRALPPRRASTTCPARRSGSRSPGWPPPRPSWEHASI